MKCTNCDNKHCYINRFCSPERKKALTLDKSFVEYTKGHNIINEGHRVYGVYFIYSGKVKVYKSDANGKMQIVRFAKSGDILGHRGYGGKNSYPISATAIEDCKICFIENKYFFEAIETEQRLTYQLMLFYARELRYSEIRVLNLGLMNTKQKIIDALLWLNAMFGKQTDSGVWEIEIMLSRQEIAEITGSTQENVIRTLSDFKKKKLIATEGKKILILDIETLSEPIRNYEHTYLEAKA